MSLISAGIDSDERCSPQLKFGTMSPHDLLLSSTPQAGHAHASLSIFSATFPVKPLRILASNARCIFLIT